MHVLVVSCSWPGSAAESSHGLFRRFDMMAAGVREVASRVDALFFVAPELIESMGTVSLASERLSQRWQMEVRVRLCPRRIVPTAQSVFGAYGAPALSIMAQTPYDETAGVQQRHALEDALLAQPDALLVHRLRSMPPLLNTRQPMPPIAFDLDDLEHVSYARSLEQPPHWRGQRLLKLRLPALRRGQGRAVRLSTRTLVCSEADRQALSRDAGTDNVVVVPNAIEIPLRTPLRRTSTLLSLGQYGYQPNQIGIEHFLDHVWPLLLQQRPDLKLVIAGPNPQRIRHFPAPPPGVEFPGFVDDVGALYADSRVVICPILAGSGTRLKLVEAAAWARPIVSTRLGAEGLGMVDGVHALLRDDPASMAQACLDLLENDTLAMKLADGARRLAGERFDRNAVVGQIAELLSELPSLAPHR